MPAELKKEVREQLYNMKQKLESTTLLTIAPNDDMWEFGFETLANLPAAVATARGRLELAAGTPRNIRAAVDRLANGIDKLYEYRDSYRKFSGGRIITARSELESWPHFNQAAHALSMLQIEYKSNKETIDHYLENLN
ncbi:MAG: hypothetical protein JOZ58_19895 [Acetobacteraceae bacterium]|nr:hypothetical protein [Acetobacteraceae bacterium]MBV8577290.1 hypothetical protein [Acetobacteraceae bacterium]